MATQKVALITAGTAGLGRAIAHALAPDFRVVINYANNTDRAQSVLAELEKVPCTFGDPQQPRFHAVQADVGNRAAIQSMVQETIQKFGRLDVVVSNAGWTRITNFRNLEEGMADEDWDKCFLYNVKAHLWLLHAAKEALEQTEGAFVSTASTAGIKPSGSSLPYSVTKAATIHLIKDLAVICSPRVRVNSVSPGLLLTDWGQKFGEEKINTWTESTKLKKVPTVDDVAAQVRGLALSSSMTGQNIVVDSGFTL